MLFWDATMILLVPAIILSIYAQFKVSSSFKHYAKVRAQSGMTGAQTARTLLDRNGLNDVQVEQVAGHLSDHYDPRSRVVRLSQDVYGGSSLASVAVAAHETGHALQHAQGYTPLTLRTTFVPLASLGSWAGPILIMVGLFVAAFRPLLEIGILFFTFAVFFQLVTLPVEFNASSRAMNLLQAENVLAGGEVKGARSVLSAAALTYVAAALVAVLQLVRLIMITQRR